MDRDDEISDDEILGPWVFEIYRRGLAHSIWDRECRLVTSHVTVAIGLLIAAAPTMRSALANIVAVTAPGTEPHEIALRAIEHLIEREGFALDARRPSTP